MEPQPSTSRSPVEDEPPAKRRLYAEEVRGMWNLVKVYRQLGTREQAVAFAEEKGRRVEGHWILGMIQDQSEDLRLEVCTDNVRSAEVLVPLIKKHVAEGTTIHTDFWRAYDCLGDHGFIHRKVYNWHAHHVKKLQKGL
ncbi:Uncharacterized protein OBRU01_11949 [Operophtera brumata]|uniref:ISXO2-like transposase domain-containing protein n=1 Tax=Operophtera brumata TaxID=104452 RepID=A0A0L7LBL3_OPEBR|nr:Uncharacterized protein OBRU01_11949 [Operophtera brumata]